MKPPSYCDDWSCPSNWSCREFWGRSREYWAFNIEAPVSLRRGPRKKGYNACDDYERDEPREWMQDKFLAQIPMEPPERGLRLCVLKGGKC